MKKTWIVKLSLIALMICSCCGLFTCEEPIEKERREFRESLEAPETLIYRGLKIGIRGIPAEALKDTALTEEKLKAMMSGNSRQMKAHKITFLTWTILKKVISPDTNASFVQQVFQYAGVAVELYELRSELRKINEDDFPTILEQIFSMGDYPNPQMLLSWYNSGYEHLILSAVWMGTKVVPKSFITYELSLVDPARLKEPELKLAAHLIRGVIFFKEQWPYMAEEEFTGYLSVAEKNRAALIPVMKTQNIAGTDSTDEALYAQIHAPGALLRGLDRLKIDKEEEGYDDLEAFLDDAKKMNMDNELVWLIGSYVKIKRGKTDEAVVYLEKLQNSSYFGDDEKEILRDVTGFLKERKPEKAMNKLTDKVFIMKIMFKYGKLVLSRTDWFSEVEKSESGQKLIRTQSEIQNEYDNVKKEFSSDQLKKIGEDAAGKAMNLIDSMMN